MEIVTFVHIKEERAARMYIGGQINYDGLTLQIAGARFEGEEVNETFEVDTMIGYSVYFKGGAE